MRSLVLLFTFIFSIPAFPQAVTEREHPRVAELQDRMTDYVRGYLQTRLQGIPFMVTVKIEAMRRKAGSKYTPQSEKLPYYDMAEEEIRDEWDDPSASIYALQARIQKATVMISLPKSLADEEVTEIKDSLTTLLRLIPGRDEIKVELRPWSMMSTGFMNYVVLAGGLLLILLVGMTLISRTWAKRLALAIADIKPRERTDDNASASVHVPAANVEGMTGPGSTSGAQGDVKFQDPLRTREFVAGRVQEIVRNPGFPNLPAMVEMERLAERAPVDLGALLMEFPYEKQKELFSLSFSAHWLKAFTEPGELTAESVALVDRLCRLQYDAESKEWEQLVIQCWRLDSQRVGFLRSIAKDEAFAILKSMPSSIAVPTARSAFPGAWAVLLDPDYKAKPIAPARVKDIYKTALNYKALNTFNALEIYKQEKDLLAYLLISTIPEEKDVYGALPPKSYLWTVRPPFYHVMELSPDEMKEGFSRISIDDWALALFNVSREHRKTLEGMLNSKQKFIFANKMRTIDQSGVDRAVIGAARERIARIFHDLHAAAPTQPREESERNAA